MAHTKPNELSAKLLMRPATSDAMRPATGDAFARRVRHARGGARCPVALALWVVLLAGAWFVPGAARAAVSATWSTPVRIEPAGLTPSAVSCPSRALCVAVDSSGNAIATADPAAANATWTAMPVDGGNAFTSVSCPSITLCVAVDRAGRALVSANPTVPGSWSGQAIDQTLVGQPRPILSVSCPTVSLCVAVDQAGNVLTSTNPAASAWSMSGAETATPDRLQGVSCASAVLCVAVDNAGRVLASAQPTGPKSAWLARAIDPALSLQAVSCATGGCVAVDSAGTVFASADPTSSIPTWSATGIDSTAALTGASCLGSTVCLAVDAAGEAFASEDSMDAQPAWTSFVADPERVAIAGVSCTADALCVAVDTHGRALTASMSLPPPPSGAEQPSVTLVEPHPSISGVPAVGSRLLCNPGTPAGATATLTYAWWRDGSPITAANASSYRVAKADATHHLQCWVTAANAAGSVTAHSAFVTVPAEGVLAAVGETVVGLARIRASRVEVPIVCSPHAARVCTIALRITAVLALPHARRARVTLAAVKARLAPAQHRTVSLALNLLARRLIAHRHRIAAQLTVAGTVIGVIDATLARQRLVLGRSPSARAASAGPLTPVASRFLAGAVPSLAARSLAGPVVTRVARGASSGPAWPIARGSASRAVTPTVLTPTPYMGWDTYFAFGPRYSEATILEQASGLIADGLQHRGYRYVWLDVGWWRGQRDSRGQIVVDRSQWPHGLAWLTSTLHAAGLLVGLYTDAGPDGCGGAHQGSYGHYSQDANAFAAWGFDAVKVDFCGGVRHRLDPRTAYSSFHAAIEANSSRRPMLLSICDFAEPGQLAGAPPFDQSAFAAYAFGPTVGNSWRTDTDVGSPGHVTFATVLRNLDADAAHPEAAGPGHWNDPDYLGPDQGLGDAQFQAQMSMWAVLAAPLMVSDDLQQISPASLAAVRNSEVLAIDQDAAGAQGTLISSEGEGQVWSKPLLGGARAVALLNRGPAPLTIQTTAPTVGMPSAVRYEVRDVWAHTTFDTSGSIAVQLPGETAALLRIFLPSAHVRSRG